MIDFYRKYRAVGNWINVFLLGSVMLPLLVLSYYNHPSPVDDYCYIDTVFKYGWLEAMNFYYTGWTGRYFGILLNHSNPLLFHWIEGFKVLPVVLLAGTVGALYWLARQLTPTLSRWAHLGFAGVVFFLYILKIPSVAEAYYWMAAFVTYTVPNLMTLCWIVVVLRWYRLESRLLRWLTALFAGFLLFATIGSSETNLLVILLLLAGWCGYRVLFQQKIDAFMLGMLGVAAVSCYLFFSAPGNEARLGGNPLSGDVVTSALSSFRKLIILSMEWITRTPLLLFSVVWLLVLSRMSPQARTYFAVAPPYVLLIYVGVLAAQLFPSYYGIGIEPTLRVINCVYFFFLVGWFYLVGVLFHYFAQKKSFAFPPLLYLGTCAVLALLVGLSFYRSPQVRMLYTDWLRGGAAAFDREMYARYALIEQTKAPEVYLPAIEHRPPSLFVGDIESNESHWWNKCTAGYFGKQTIYLLDKNVTP